MKYGKFEISNLEFVDPDIIEFDVDPNPTDEELKEIQEFIIEALRDSLNNEAEV